MENLKFKVTEINLQTNFMTAKVRFTYQNEHNANFNGSIEIEIKDDLKISEIKDFAIQKAKQILNVNSDVSANSQ